MLASKFDHSSSPGLMRLFARGSAFPATLAFQIRELQRETEGDLKLDAILTVIDAENFTGYEDTSPTARMQASYTDMIIIVRKVRKSTNQRSNSPVQNKWEHVSERALDILIDHLNTLNDLTPKIRCDGRNGVEPGLIFGLDSKLYLEEGQLQIDVKHHDEVETVTVYAGSQPPHKHDHDKGGDCSCKTHEHGTPSSGSAVDLAPVSVDVLSDALSKLSKESVWRVKGFLRTDAGIQILNWAFGRYELVDTSSIDVLSDHETVKLTVMGERGEVKRHARKLAEALRAEIL